MKIKNDFVTNSSSTCFIVSIAIDEIKGFLEYIKELSRNPDASGDGCGVYFISGNMKALLDYTNGIPYDWISKAMGGLQFINFSEYVFRICEEIIENGGAIAYVTIDNTVCDKFERNWQDCIVHCGG